MLKNWKILLFSAFVMVFTSSCKKNPPQYPTSYGNDGFLDYSKKFNKQLKDLELEKIQEYIRNHKEDFLYTNDVFFMTRTKMDSVRRVQDFDTITFEHQISNLKDSVIYSFDDKKSQTMVLGQSTIIPGLEYGLKRMSSGEEATLLLPSSLCYGVTGDGDKIGADQPLKIQVRLKNIVINEN